MKEFWDERYRAEAFVYGEAPNAFLKAQLEALKPGAILFPAEGEGRNAVYAATLGWTVSAFDQSVEGQKKALRLAAKHGVALGYRVGEFREIAYAPEQFDAIALIYAHFSADTKSAYHRMLDTFLRKGGTLIFEAYSKDHLRFNEKNDKVGGPRDPGMLFSLEEIRADFPGYEVLELSQQELEQNEGMFHTGMGSVIRFVGRK